MKKVALLILLVVIAMPLIAAAPASSAPSQSAKGPCLDPATGRYLPCPPGAGRHGPYKIKIPGQGEPTMEKVTFFYYLAGSPNLGGIFWNWDDGDIKSFYLWKSGCLRWYWRIRAWKMPIGCNFRYQY